MNTDIDRDLKSGSEILNVVIECCGGWYEVVWGPTTASANTLTVGGFRSVSKRLNFTMGPGRYVQQQDRGQIAQNIYYQASFLPLPFASFVEVRILETLASYSSD
jgi:hypothetical protein